MANNMGIQLGLDIGYFVENLDKAIAEINKNPRAVKIGFDYKDAFAKLQSDLKKLNVTVNIPKIDFNADASSIGRKISESVKSAVSVNNAAFNNNPYFINLDSAVSEFMKKFDIVKKTSEKTSEEIRASFNKAFSDVITAKASGNIDKIQNAFSNLINLSKEFTKTYKNSEAALYLENLKAQCGKVVPVAKNLKSELEYVYGKGEVRKALNAAFTSKGWKWSENYSTDQFFHMDVLDQNLKSGLNVVDNLTNLIDKMTAARQNAKKQLSGFDTMAFNSQDIIDYVNNLIALNEQRNNQTGFAENAAQAENKVNSALNQGTEALRAFTEQEKQASETAKHQASSLQTYNEVLNKFAILEENGFGKFMPTNAFNTMLDLGSHKNAVDALGRAFDSISSLSESDKEYAFQNIIKALEFFRTGDFSNQSVQNLVKELNTIIADSAKIVQAENNKTKSVNQTTDAVKRQAEEFKKTNEIMKTVKHTSVTGDVTRHETYGTSAKHATIDYLNGKFTGVTASQNFASQAEAIAKSNAEADKFKTIATHIINLTHI